MLYESPTADQLTDRIQVLAAIAQDTAQQQVETENMGGGQAHGDDQESADSWHHGSHVQPLGRNALARPHGQSAAHEWAAEGPGRGTVLHTGGRPGIPGPRFESNRQTGGQPYNARLSGWQL